MPAITLNSNLPSQAAQRRLGESTTDLSRAVMRLSTGRRINRAADDAAGLAVAAGLGLDRRVFVRGLQNVNDGIGYLSVADDALGELSGVLTRARELAERSANGVYSDPQRASMDKELTALAAEYNRILGSTEFNGRAVFSPAGATLAVQAGYGTPLSASLGSGGGQAGQAAGPPAPERVDLDSSGTQASGGSSQGPALSADGRYVAFRSSATNLVAGDTNAAQDIFLRDRQAGVTTRVSVDSSGVQANGISSNLSISGDGRYVAFQSSASNLVAGDTNGQQDVFVYDRQTGTTARVSVDGTGVQGNGVSKTPAMSADGRYVAFQSAATNLVAGDTKGQQDVFVRDLQTGATTRVSVDSAGAQGNGTSGPPAISADGRYVAFQSSATNLVAGDTNGFSDEFVYDRQTGVTTRVNLDAAGTQGNDASFAPALSADGRSLGFASDATNLIAGDTNGRTDVFVVSLPTAAVGATGTWSLSTLAGLSVSTRPAALAALDALPAYVAEVAGVRGAVGAGQSRFATAASNLTRGADGFAVAESRVTDADVAQEAAALVRARVLEQAGTAVLAQANRQPALALALLGVGTSGTDARGPGARPDPPLTIRRAEKTARQLRPVAVA